MELPALSSIVGPLHPEAGGLSYHQVAARPRFGSAQLNHLPASPGRGNHQPGDLHAVGIQKVDDTTSFSLATGIQLPLHLGKWDVRTHTTWYFVHQMPPAQLYTNTPATFKSQIPSFPQRNMPQQAATSQEAHFWECRRKPTGWMCAFFIVLFSTDQSPNEPWVLLALGFVDGFNPSRNEPLAQNLGRRLKPEAAADIRLCIYMVPNGRPIECRF